MTSAKPQAGYRAGLAVREEAVRLLADVLGRHHALDDLLQESLRAGALSGFDARDRALARAIVATSLRRKGQIDDLLGRFLAKGLPARAGSVPEILLSAATQVLFMRISAHAAIDIAVTLAGRDREGNRLKGLVNAVLRNLAREGPALVAAQDVPRLATPDWLWKRWVRAYGEPAARAIARAHLDEAPLDLTMRDGDASAWAERLGGIALPTGTVRLPAHTGRIEALPGFGEGAWWVQDAAAALPARLLGDVAGKRVLDLCAAPGGKTLQLAAAGARVTAVDLSESRLALLRDNLARTGLDAEVICADALAYTPPAPFDAVLLDAPCSATGTIRRHPDIPHTKREPQIAALAALQRELLAHALTLVAPGGTVVYCACSLEPEEGEGLIANALSVGTHATCLPISPQDLAGLAHLLTPHGELRTLPSQTLDAEHGITGLDGFYACRLSPSG